MLYLILSAPKVLQTSESEADSKHIPFFQPRKSSHTLSKTGTILVFLSLPDLGSLLLASPFVRYCIYRANFLAVKAQQTFVIYDFSLFVVKGYYGVCVTNFLT